jgi:nitrate/TMAO reductase-like tetraheme cytochrome c subunit
VSPAREVYRWGSALDWSIVLTAGVCVLILALIAASRIVFRHRQTDGTVLWLHLLALGVFPLFLLASGNFAVLEYATQEQFCGACHRTMQVYVDDMLAVRGTSLAARHFQDRFSPGTGCYACHADYGIHGTFDAKLSGLKDVYKYYTRTYRLPLHMPRPYSNMLCLKCHDGARRFMAEDTHLGAEGVVSGELMSNETACTECHKPAHRIPSASAAAGPAR